MNKMPAALPDAAIGGLLLCVPYLAKHKSGGDIVTLIKVGANVLVIEGANTAQIDHDSFDSYYEVIRKFVQGEDTVTIAAW